MTQEHKQELFDKAIKGVLNQGALCLDELEQCNYTNEQGHHCGIGWCIPEEILQKELHHNDAAITTLFNYKAEDSAMTQYLFNNYGGDSIQLRAYIQSLQNVHDTALNIVDFKLLAREFAKAHNLEHAFLIN